MGFNKRKPPDRTVCVAVDLSAAFDTVCHNKLLSKINRSPLPPATSRWLSSYLRGRQAKTCFRGVKSSSRKVHSGVPQGSKLSPSLFSFYIADRTSQAERVSGRNNILKALAGTSWGQQKETLLMTYKAVGRSIINYAAPVWSTNLRDTNYRNIQYTQNEALRISTGCHKMSSVDHLHAEANMLKVKEHSELLSAQYLARCLEPENVNFSITTREPPKRMMKETLFTRHRSAVEPLMIAKVRKTTLQAIHTAAVSQAVTSLGRNVGLDF